MCLSQNSILIAYKRQGTASAVPQKQQYGTWLYSIFDSSVYRNYEVKWLFPQEKATFDTLVLKSCPDASSFPDDEFGM
jgi:hypothetical protein